MVAHPDEEPDPIPASQPSAPPARHAEVIPSAILPWIGKKLDCWAGEFHTRELMAWTRASDLTDSARAELRTKAIQRLRNRMQQVWPVVLRIKLGTEWASKLTPVEQKLVQEAVLSLTSEQRPFHSLTLHEVKTAMHQPLDRVLSILARIEAVGWVPESSPAPWAKPSRQPLTAELEKPQMLLSEEIRTLAQGLSLRPWVSQIAAHDLRFSAPDGNPPLPWIQAQLKLTHAHPAVGPLVQALEAAHHLTAAQEARAVIELVAAHRFPRRTSELAARSVDMLLARHLSADGLGLTLEQVGAQFELTRERVRQVCGALEEALVSWQMATPALDRVLHAAARIAPASLAEANTQLAPFIGEGAGIESLIGWAGVLGRKSLPVKLGVAQVRLKGQPVTARIVEAAGSSGWMVSALRYASRDCSSMGCSNLMRIAGMLALRDGVAPGPDALEATLSATQDFRWLDQDAGWFTLGDTSDCAVAKRVRKIVAVAKETVGADEIAGALASDDVWLYREETKTLSIPPVHVLRELFVGWRFLTVIQHSRFLASSPLDNSGVLSDAEALAVSIIEKHGGVACRFELKDAILEAVGITDVAVAVMLGSSPIFVKLEHGIYALRGRRIGGAALDDARKRIRTRLQGGVHNIEGLGPDDFTVRATEASLRHEQYALPPRFLDKFRNRTLPALDANGNVLGQVRIKQAGAMAGLNELFKDIQEGDVLVVTVMDAELRVRRAARELTKSPDTSQGSKAAF